MQCYTNEKRHFLSVDTASQTGLFQFAHAHYHQLDPSIKQDKDIQCLLFKTEQGYHVKLTNNWTEDYDLPNCLGLITFIYTVFVSQREPDLMIICRVKSPGGYYHLSRVYRPKKEKRIL